MADDSTYDALLDKLVPQVMARESSGRLNPPDSPTGAIGPMQIEPGTAKMYGVNPDHLRIPAVNMSVGRRYLGDLLKKYNGDVYATLAAYNAGPGNVDRATIPNSTRGYVRDIMGKLGEGVSTAMGEGVAVAGEGSETKPVVRLGYYKAPDGTQYYTDGKQWFDPHGVAMGAGTASSTPSGGGTAPAGGLKLKSIRMKGMELTAPVDPNEPTTATRSAQQRLSMEGQKVVTLADDLRKLYSLRIAPKLKAGKVGSLSQGWAYYAPGLSPTDADPDVSEFITKSGAFAQLMNSYYSNLGGSSGRPGVGSYEVITTPHIPHPPGFMELAEGRWQLQKQAKQLEDQVKTVKLLERQGKPEEYGTDVGPTKYANGTVGLHKKTGNQMVAFDGRWYEIK